MKIYFITQDYAPIDPSTPGLTARDFFGPDERLQHLADLFNISLEKAKLLAIEAPFRCDYGYNIEFKGEFYGNFGLTVSSALVINIMTNVCIC